MKTNVIHLALISFLVLAYASCGRNKSIFNNNDDGGGGAPPPPEAEEQEQGNFRGVANAVNPGVFGTSSALSIQIENDQFTVDIFGSGPATTHGQYLHEGEKCPTLADDINGDKVIDAVEGEKVYGPRVLVLDSDLTSVAGVFPFGPQYHYSQKASLSEITGDLKIDFLHVENKVITIEGVPDATDLPSGIQGSKSEFPIACGQMKRAP